jgi:hypothetical protein
LRRSATSAAGHRPAAAYAGRGSGQRRARDPRRHTPSGDGALLGDGRGTAAAGSQNATPFAPYSSKNADMKPSRVMIRAMSSGSGGAAAGPVGGTGRRSRACPDGVPDERAPIRQSLGRRPAAIRQRERAPRPLRRSSSPPCSLLPARVRHPGRPSATEHRDRTSIRSRRRVVRNLGWHAPCNRGGRKACGKKAKRDAKAHGDARKIHSRRNIKRQE